MQTIALLLAMNGPPGGPPAPPPLALRVERIVAPDGTLGNGGWIVVRGGRIEVAGGAAPPPGAQTLEFEGGVACPGFVDAVTGLGARGDLEETARAFTPEILAADAFHPDHTEFLRAARGGITTVGLSPEGNNVIGGRVAVVRTHGDREVAELAATGPLRVTLADSAFDPDREPTSRMGALPKLREMAASGALTGGLIVEAGSADEIRIALETFGGGGRTLALLGARRADEAIELLRGKPALALLGPYGLDTGPRDLRLAKRLHEAGVEVAFTAGGAPGGLRLTAALAVRSGLDRAAALRGLTTVPARILGIESDSGSIEPGRRADLVVFDGDPLDLAAKVQLVLAGGAIVEPKEPGSSQEPSP